MRRRQADKTDTQSLARTPSARTLAWLMSTSRDNLSKSESITIEEGVPSLVEAREIISDFHGMVRARAQAQLPAWIDRAANSLVSSFANGIRRDIAAVDAAISSPWSNGQTEGQVTRLKLIKRQMYGRAKLDLLEARLIGAA
jgi:transposase